MGSSQLLDEGAGLRSDAERNRAGIVAAARAVFTEAGMDVPTSRIARRAGVAVATLYRRFPTREALVEAAFADQHADCAQFLADVERHPDVWFALRAAIHRFCADQVSDKGYTAQLLVACGAGDAPPGVEVEFAVEVERLRRLLQRARESGALRPDIGWGDLNLLVAGNAGVIAGVPAAQAVAASRRFVELVLRSFEASAR